MLHCQQFAPRWSNAVNAPIDSSQTILLLKLSWDVANEQWLLVMTQLGRLFENPASVS